MPRGAPFCFPAAGRRMTHRNECYDCGLTYGGAGWIEAVVPNDIWARISPTGDEGGLLCINCIASRCASLGLEGVPVMLAAGPLRFVEYRTCEMEAEKNAVELPSQFDRTTAHILEIARRVQSEVRPEHFDIVFTAIVNALYRPEK